MELIEQISPSSRTEVGALAADPFSLAQRIVAAAGRLPHWLRPSVIATMMTGFTAFGITAVQGILLARLLGPEARGEYGTAILFTSTMAYIGLMGTQFAVARRAASNPASCQNLSQSVLRLGGLTGLGTIFVVAILAFTTLPAEKRYLAALCVVCAFAQPLEHMRLLLLAVDQGSGNFRRFNSVTLATSMVLPSLLLILWLTGRISVVAAALLTLVPPIIGLGLRLALGKTRPRRQTLLSPRPIALVKEGVPYLFSTTVCDIYGRLDQYLFLWLGSFLAQGLYAAAVPAAGVMLVGSDALALFSFNAGSRKDVPMSRKQLILGGARVAIFQVLLAVLFMIVIGPMIIFLYGNAFAAAVPFALALVPAQAINGFAQFVEGHLRGRGIVTVGIWARLVAAAIMVAIVLLTFPRLHELSIPLAACAAHGLVALTLAWFAIARMPCPHSTSSSTSPLEATA